MGQTWPQASRRKKIESAAMALDALERLHRQQALANAIASVRLEGLDIDPKTLADMECYVRGEMTIDDVL
jgi:hypothetical protein